MRRRIASCPVVTALSHRLWPYKKISVNSSLDPSEKLSYPLSKFINQPSLDLCITMTCDDKVISSLHPCAIGCLLQSFINVPHKSAGEVLGCSNFGENMFLTLLEVADDVVQFGHF